MSRRHPNPKRPCARQRAQDAQTKAYLTGVEIAAVARVSSARTYGALARGLKPGASRVGRSYRATLDQVHAWVAAGCPDGGGGTNV
jgi:hypothetical protein